MITKEEFEKLVSIKLLEEDGKLVYDGNLDLEDKTDITELPENLRVLGGLNLRNSGITKLPKGLEIEGLLEISETDIEELPEDTMFGGSLYADKMKKPFSFPKVVNINGHFDCEGTTIKRMPEEVYVKWSYSFSRSTFDRYPKVMEFGYGLYLNETDITEMPKGLKEVYGSFDISHTRITKLNDNFVVYNRLILSYTLIEVLLEGLIVGDELYLDNSDLMDYSNLHKVCTKFIVTKGKYNEIKDTLTKHSFEPYKKYYCDNNNLLVSFEPNYKGAYLFENENGKYIKADNIFGKIVEQKGNVYHVKLGKSEEISYLVTDGEGRWSHGKTLDEAKDDLLYKITDRDKSDYEGLTLDSELSFEDAITCYRVITGACSFGTRDFVENRLGENKKEVYTIKEIISLTEGEYGNKVFKDFFCKE